MNETTRLVLGTSMRDMFAKGYLNICTVDKCMEIAGMVRGGPTYKLLAALHCINFKDMPPELQSKITAMIGELFDGLSVDQLMQAVEPPAKSKLLTRFGIN